MEKQYSISSDLPPEPDELMTLFNQTTWAKKRSVEGIQSLIKKTDVYITIRDENKLIGYGRAISDGVYRALLDDIIVDKNYQKKGLGEQIVSGLLDKLKGVDEIFLNTKEHLEIFYKKYGFERADCLTMKL